MTVEMTVSAACGALPSAASAARTSAVTMPPLPGRERPLEDDQPPRAAIAAECRAHGLGRERAERGDAERADPHPVVAQLVDRVLDGAEHRAEGDDDQLRVFGAVGPHQARRLGRPNSRAKPAATAGIRSRACRIRSAAR